MFTKLSFSHMLTCLFKSIGHILLYNVSCSDTYQVSLSLKRHLQFLNKIHHSQSCSRSSLKKIVSVPFIARIHPPCQFTIPWKLLLMHPTKLVQALQSLIAQHPHFHSAVSSPTHETYLDDWGPRFWKMTQNLCKAFPAFEKKKELQYFQYK